MCDAWKRPGLKFTNDGICRTSVRGGLVDFEEKPEYDFLVNTGMYILGPDVLKYIPFWEEFDMTKLIHDLVQKAVKIENKTINISCWSCS